MQRFISAICIHSVDNNSLDITEDINYYEIRVRITVSQASFKRAEFTRYSGGRFDD